MNASKILSFLFLGILAMSFILAADEGSTTAIASITSSTQNAVTYGSDLIGIIIGVFILIFLFSNIDPFKGNFRKSFIFMAIGISLQVVSMIYTFVFKGLKLYSLPGGIDIHHLLMTIGIVFFSFAVYNLREVVKGTSNA